MKRKMLGLFLLAAAACQQPDGEPVDDMDADTVGDTLAVAEATLYDRLGGEAAITAVVDTFVSMAAADAELNFTRQGTANEWEATPANIDTLKTRLVQFVGQGTGGPQTYEGQDMTTVHEGMAITGAEFDRLGGHLLRVTRLLGAGGRAGRTHGDRGDDADRDRHLGHGRRGVGG